MSPYILTVWLLYSEPSLLIDRIEYPDLATCLAAQDDWHGRAADWLKRSRLWNRADIVAVSRCDPPEGATTLREAHLRTLPYQVPMP
jgi:hypothetical protein